MAKYINSYCRICGEGYHRCNCQSEGNWRKVTDTAEHYQIFCVVRDYVNGVIDADKASELLDGMDLSEKDKFRDNVKEVLTDIASKRTKVEKKTATQPIDKRMEEKASRMANAIVGAGDGKHSNAKK